MARACSAASMWAWRLLVRTASSGAARLGGRRYRVAMPTRAWRAICSSGASRPWSQNTCRGASTMASRLGWASRRTGGGAGGGGGVMAVGLGGRRASWEQCTREYGGLPPHCAGREVDRSVTSVYGRSGIMTTNVETTGRDAVLVQDAAQIQMMGLPVLEALPARGVPYQRVDPFLLVHESRFRLSELSGLDTRHPHRGFDNLWYILEGSASTGHSTGPGGAI